MKNVFLAAMLMLLCVPHAYAQNIPPMLRTGTTFTCTPFPEAHKISNVLPQTVICTILSDVEATDAAFFYQGTQLIGAVDKGIIHWTRSIAPDGAALAFAQNAMFSRMGSQLGDTAGLIVYVATNLRMERKD